MSIIDQVQEIFHTMRTNKTRTALTGFSVAWGIFMLIVLLGSGNGLMNGVQSNFTDRSSNVVRVYDGWTTMPYGGFPKDRHIKIYDEDLQYLKDQFPNQIESISGVRRQWGIELSKDNNFVNGSVFGVENKYAITEGVKVYSGNGRFINDMDVRENRKVIVIHPKTADLFFGGNEKAIGQTVRVNALAFRVIGVYDAPEASENQNAYIPVTTFSTIYAGLGTNYNYILLQVKGLKTLAENEEFTKNIRKVLAQKYQFNPDDESALWIWNRFEDYLQTQMIFGFIRIAIWVIGIFTLLSGIVGVSNIMLISVKERTKEFGIRKAIGASPGSILRTVVVEAIVITSLFGYVGMFLGVGLTELVNYVMTQSGVGDKGSDSMTIFLNPTVDMSVVLMATGVLIISGTLAGFFPASKAVRIRPVEAFAAK